MKLDQIWLKLFDLYAFVAPQAGEPLNEVRRARQRNAAFERSAD